MRRALYAIVLFSHVALADDLVSAKKHFDAGVRAYDASQWEIALAEFRAAYADRPAPSLLRNIALCLAKLERNAEAIEALEKMLALGGPEVENVRAAAERTLKELRAKAATVRVNVVFNLPPATSAPTPSVTIDGKPIENVLEPKWVDPGAHAIAGTAPGFFDQSQSVQVKAGDRDVAVTLSFVPRAAPGGTLHVKTNVATAIVKIDGSMLGTGKWTGQVARGKHRVEAEARGYVPTLQEIDISEGEEEEVSLDLSIDPRLPKVPPITQASDWYLAGAIGAFGGELATKEGGLGMTSFTFEARLGRRYGHYIGFELDGELVRGVAGSANGDREITFVHTHAAIGPGIRFFTSERPFRFTIAGIGGIANQLIKRTVTVKGTDVESHTGGSPTGFLQIEGGAQLDVSHTVGFELVGLVGFMGMNDPETLTGSVMARYGGRIALTFSF